MTAVAASSNGMPAAMNAPNTTTSRMSVIGSEVDSALRKFWLIRLLMIRSSLAPPASAMRSPGCAACNVAIARSAGSTAWSSLAPVTLKVTSADLPSAEISDPPPLLNGDRMSLAVAVGRSRNVATTCCVARRSSASVRKVPARAWISTSSAGGGPLTLRFCRVRSATPDWPGSFEGRFLAPINWPATKTIATSASQPNTVVLRWRTLHPATRSTSGPRFRPGVVGACFPGGVGGFRGVVGGCPPDCGNTELCDWRMVTSLGTASRVCGPRPRAGTHGRGFTGRPPSAGPAVLDRLARSWRARAGRSDGEGRLWQPARATGRCRPGRN